MTDIETRKLKSNGWFAILKYPYEKQQHPNQQCGLDLYVDVINHHSGRVNTVKLYENKSGLHFKADGATHYLSEFEMNVLYVPFQMISLDEVKTE